MIPFEFYNLPALWKGTVQALLVKGAPSERLHAVRLTWNLSGPSQRLFEAVTEHEKRCQG